MGTDESKTYSPEEVHRIIQRALQRREHKGIRHEELLEIGRDLGLDTRTIEAAVDGEQQDAARRRAVDRWRKSRKFGFHWHLWSYLVTSAVLLLVNAAVPGPWWFQWPVIGWGAGVVFHYQSVYFPTPRQIQRAYSRRAEAEAS